MTDLVKRVIIVGGGSAGWLTAGVIAAEHRANSPSGLQVVLVESPGVNPIGVGEGTWPTMRGNVTGSLPDGEATPNSRSAIAGPAMDPGCHA